MRIGDRVTYTEPNGTAHDARVVGVGGSTPSLWKLLDISVGDVVVQDVAHVGDEQPGDGAWAIPESLETPAPIESPSLVSAPQDEAPHAPQEQEEGQDEEEQG